MSRRRLGTIAALSGLFLAGAAFAQGGDLATEFKNPPPSARPRVWWHWMNGNITKDGIRQDLEWMKRVGIGGVQNFDANLTTPQVVDKRLVFMTPEWKDAFRYAAGLAARLGLEMAIAASPGWSETGGPWVQPKDGLKKLVWSETEVEGGHPFVGKLAAPPSTTGPFQSLPMARSIEEMLGATAGSAPKAFYADVRVLAFPLSSSPADDLPRYLSNDGQPIDASALMDDSLETALDVPVGTAAAPGVIELSYDAPHTIRSATILVSGAKTMFSQAAVMPRLEAKVDGRQWQPIAELPLGEVPTTVSFAPVTAGRFRVVFTPSNAPPAPLGDPAPGVAADPGFAAIAGGGTAPTVKVAMLGLSSEARVDRFEAKAGFSIVPDYYALRRDGAADLGAVDPGKVVNLTDRMQSDGSLDWAPPQGRWRIVRLGYSLLGTTNHPASPEATGLEVDKFDRTAVRSYLETYLGMYRNAAGPDLIGAHGVRALLTDSIEVGAANWTPRMIEQFRDLRGYDPTPWLPALTGVIVGSRAQSDAFLYDYRRTLADLIASEHYGTVAAVAHEHALKVYGEALEDNRPSLGDDMAMRSHADVPMAAMWTFSRQSGPNPSYVADIKGAASVAHIYGQNLVAAESMTSAMAPWAFAPSDLRRIIDLEFVTGVNRPVVHTSVHQPVDDKLPGLSLFVFGQYFNRHETWAEMAKPWVDYMARNAYLLQQGVNVADVAYFYGEEAPLTGLYGQRPVADAPVRYAYDFVNPDALTHRLSVDRGDLVTASGARYHVLYLGGSSREMTLPILRRIAGLAEAGATVVGLAPTGSPSLADDRAQFDRLVRILWSGQPITTVGKGKVIASADVERALRSVGVSPDFTYSKPRTDSQILFLHRRAENADIYLVDNRRDRPETVEARFRATGRQPEIWHADTGLSEPVSYHVENGETIVPLSFEPEESFFVVFRTPTAVTEHAISKPNLRPLIQLDGAWNVTFQPDRGAPPGIRLGALGSLSENADPAIKYFSGIATYRKTFTLPRGTKRGSPLWLDLGRVGDLAEVRVNGVPVGTAWHAPYRLDIGQAVRSGANDLEVRVADLWVNRLIGDAQPGAKKITWTAMPTYRSDAPLRPSGLIGPVTLLAADVR